MIPSLPSLPPLPNENDDYRYRPAGRSIITVLSEEHEQIVALSAELAAGSPRRRDLTGVVTATVTRHLSAEEQYLYPVVRTLLAHGEHIADREIKHDTAILKNLALLQDLDADARVFGELIRTIEEDLRRHEQTCSREIFPALRDAAYEADLIRLGNRVELAEEAAPTRPHPTVVAAPWNKVTEPVLGLVDKAKDALTRRVTHAEDL